MTVSVQMRDFVTSERLNVRGAYRSVSPFGRPSTRVGEEQLRTTFGRCKILSSILPRLGTIRDTGLVRFL